MAVVKLDTPLKYQPATYQPEFCEQIIELGRQGKSVVAMACHFAVLRQTLYDWAKALPEFADAFDRAKIKAQARWEFEGDVLNKNNPNFHPQLWIKIMQARFREDYQDANKIELGGAITLVFSKTDKTL